MNNPKLFSIIVSFCAITISLIVLLTNQIPAETQKKRVKFTPEEKRESAKSCKEQLLREMKVNDAYLELLTEHYKGWRTMDEAPNFGKVLIYTDQEQIFEATYDKTSRKWLVEVVLDGDVVYKFLVRPLKWREYPYYM